MPILAAVSRKNAMADVQKNEIVRFPYGDRVAFEALYQRYWRKVLSFTRLYIKDSYEQEEVVQQVFIRLWENRTTVDAGKDFDGFRIRGDSVRGGVPQGARMMFAYQA